MPRADQRRATRGGMALSVSESEARHRALVSALPDGVLLQDADGTVLLANPRAHHLLGLTGPADAAIPVPRRPHAANLTPDAGPGDVIDLDAADLPTPLAQLTLATMIAVATGEVQHGIVVPITLDGQTRLLRATAVPLLGDDDQPHAVVSSFQDTTDQPDQAAGQRRGEEMFRQTMQNSPIGVAITALNGRFLRVNRTLCRMFGYRADELQERTLFEVMHAADVAETSLRVGAMLHGDLDTVTIERRYLGQGEMQLWGLLSITMIRDSRGRPLHFVVQIEDVTEVHRAQDLITHMTLHDPLTGLANRTLILDRTQKALDRSRHGDRKVAVLQCDVDQFKLINDGAGQEQGDAVLVEIGRRISRTLQAGESAGRLGGDEFIVVCTDIIDEREAVAVAERLQHAIGVPLKLGGLALAPTVSIGIAVSSTPGADPLTLLRDADLATYRAKERGRNRWDLIDGGLRRRALERLDLEQALRVGISAGELELHFQPIVDVTSRAIVGREALVRWNHPERGMLAPMLFLPVAEESGLIIEVGAWVLAAATKAAAAAPRAGGYVAVNVSPNQVSRPGLADSVQKALADAGLPAERLVIELTESVMLSAAPSARQELEQLDSLGVRIVVDDFGTGFSALSYLRDLPVSGIKVDRSFTAGLGSDPQCDRIVEALTGLGHGLGVDVVVEGVETEKQREILAAIGAEHAQGYLFGRPAPTFDLTTAP